MTSVSVNEWVNKQPHTKKNLKELAAMRHQEMAPLEYGSECTGIWNRQSTRVEFCRSVATRAEHIAIASSKNMEWRQIFSDVRDFKARQKLDQLPAVLKGLLTEADLLMNNLEKFRHEKHDPLLVISIDKISSLLREE